MTIPWAPPALSDAAPADLFRLYASTLSELRARGLVRTQNPPVGDYAEWLVHRAVGGILADNSVKSYDICGSRYGSVQVKARAVSLPPRSDQLQTSPFRSEGFEFAALVMLSDIDYSVVRASMLPLESIRELWSWRSHVNGHTLRMTEPVMGHLSARDITAEVRAAAEVGSVPQGG